MTQGQQPKALSVADQIGWLGGNMAEAAKELRAQHTRIAELEAQLVAESARTAGQKLRADQMTQQHAMQAKMHAQASAQLAAVQQGVQPPFMYAIADGYGQPFFEEQGFVSSEAKDLQPEVDSLNQNLDGEPPYAVVPVYTHPAAPQAVQAAVPEVLGWVHKTKTGKLGSKFYTYEPHCDHAVRDDGGEKIAVVAAPAHPAEGEVQ